VPGTVALNQAGGGRVARVVEGRCRSRRGCGGRGGPGGAQNFNIRRNQFLKDEGVAVVVTIGGGRSEDGTVLRRAWVRAMLRIRFLRPPWR
jgi:hypothetical protein